MRELTTAFGRVLICLALLTAGVFSYAGNMVSDSSFKSLASGTSVANEGVVYNYGYWRFYSVAGANGSMNVIAPGRDGSNVAVRLSRTADTGDTGLDLDYNRIRVLANHRYRIKVWVRSSTGTVIRITAPSYADDGSLIADSFSQFNTASNWSVYAMEYTAPSVDANVNVGLHAAGVGSVEVDDLAVEDVSTIVGNMVADPALENFASGTSVTAEGVYGFGCWRYYSVAGAGGSLDAIAPGRDGNNVAVRLSRASDAGDSGLDLDGTKIRVLANHHYRIKVWARSAAGAALKITSPTYADDGSLVTDLAKVCGTTPNWSAYVLEYVAPASDARINMGLHVAGVGSVDVDDFTVEDISTIIGNLVPDPTLESFASGTSLPAEGIYGYGTWRFYSVAGSGGTLDAFAPGRDGSDVAARLSRTSDAGDTGLDLDSSRIRVLANHRYRLKVWARTSTGTPLKITAPAYDDSGNLIVDWARTCYPSANWSAYMTEYVAPANDANLNAGLHAAGVGSVEVDDLSVEDITAIVGNLTPDPTFESFAIGTSVIDEGIYGFGCWRFYSVAGAGGTLNALSPGRDGTDVAVRLSRASDIGDTGLDYDGSRIRVLADHRYRLKVWARSDAGTSLRLTAPTYADDGSLVSDLFAQFGTTSTWSLYSMEYTAPANDAYVNIGLHIAGVGSVDVDDFTLEDIGTLTGTISSTLSGGPIAGAVVSISSGASATTGPDGVYTVDVPRLADYEMTVSADGYISRIVTGSDVVGTVTQDVGLSPSSSQAWAVTDTFTRADNSDLGHTEDANAVAWMKASGNAGSSISGGALVMPSGTAPCGVLLGNGFAPADFSVSIQMTWLDFVNSLWSGIAYRQTTYGGQGYWVNCPWEGDRIELWFQGTLVATAAANTTWGGVTLKVRADGSSHKVWLNDQLVIDVVDTHYLGGGSLGIYSDQYNTVKWDNLNMSSNAVPTTMGNVVAAKSQPNGTLVGVTGAVVTGVYDGFFYIEDTSRASGIKVVSTTAVSVGQVVDVIGILGTQNGEKYILASQVTPTGTDTIAPLGMNNKAAVDDMAVGLLVKAWGKVVSKTTDYLYVDDGSGVADASGGTGIRVQLSGLTVSPSLDSNIAVTGVLGIAQDGGNAVLVIRPRTDQDIL
ncbi:MAG: carboxypeptidase regulatory-like domain-containing protein [Armatimonadota bacterium]